MWGWVTSAINGVKKAATAAKKAVNNAGSVLVYVLVPGVVIGAVAAGAFHWLVSAIAATAKGALWLGSLVSYVAAKTGITLILPYVSAAVCLFFAVLGVYHLTKWYINSSEAAKVQRLQQELDQALAASAEKDKQLEQAIAVSVEKDAIVLTVRGECAQVRQALEELKKAHQDMNAQNAREVLEHLKRTKQLEDRTQELEAHRELQETNIAEMKQSLEVVISQISKLVANPGATISPTTFIIPLSNTGAAAAGASSGVGTSAAATATGSTLKQRKPAFRNE